MNEITESDYTLDYFDFLQRRYFMADGWSLRRMSDVFNSITLNPGEEVLDAGCGWGTIAIEATKRGCSVTGIDFSSVALEIAQKTAKTVFGSLPIRFVKGNVTHLPFPDNSFDKLISADLVGHLTDEECSRFIMEAMRVLRPGGVMLLYTPNSRNITVSNRLIRWLAMSIFHKDEYNIRKLDIPEMYDHLRNNPGISDRTIYNYLACAPKNANILIGQVKSCGFSIQRVRISRTKTWLSYLPYPLNTYWGGHVTVVANKPISHS